MIAKACDIPIGWKVPKKSLDLLDAYYIKTVNHWIQFVFKLSKELTSLVDVTRKRREYFSFE